MEMVGGEDGLVEVGSGKRYGTLYCSVGASLVEGVFPSVGLHLIFKADKPYMCMFVYSQICTKFIVLIKLENFIFLHSFLHVIKMCFR